MCDMQKHFEQTNCKTINTMSVISASVRTSAFAGIKRIITDACNQLICIFEIQRYVWEDIYL